MCLELAERGQHLAGAFANFLPGMQGRGTLFVLFVITIAAAEVTVGLAIVIANYRNRRTVQADEYDELRG